MLAGQTATYEGHQVALFPMDMLYATQVSPEPFSHCCGHPVDLIGSHDAYPIYAPFDCTLYNSGASGNRRMYVSDSEVWTLKGLQTVSVSFTHDNTPPTKTHFKQGELIAHTGRAGDALGDHVHTDQALYANAPLVSYGVVCEHGNMCYAMRDDCAITDVYYLTGDEAIRSTMGLEFETWTGSPIYIRGFKKPWLWSKKIRLYKKRGY